MELEEPEPITDDELAALALAADPASEVPADAVPLRSVGTFGMLGGSGAGAAGFDDPGDPGGLLPDWYMPSPTGGPRHHASWQRRVAYVLIGTFLAIDAAGLCSTYGWLTIA